MSVHDEHRSRLKQRYLTSGMDAMEDHVVLELLLTYAIARKDVNPIAHALLERFGSLAGVLEASVAELQEVPGIGEHSALLLHMMPDLARRYDISRASDGPVLDSTARAGAFLVPQLRTVRDERIYLLCLDARCRKIAFKLLTEGDVNSAQLSIRRLVETALSCKATYVILAHNHPAGTLAPSRDDLDTTRRVKEALRAVEITLADHIIVAGCNYLSLADEGYLKD